MKKGKKKCVIWTFAAFLIGGILGGLVGQFCGEKQAANLFREKQAQLEQENKSAQKEWEEKNTELQRRLHKELNGLTVEDLPWNLTLVNENYPMEKGYVPELVEVEDGYSVDKRIAKPLKEMLAAAEADGMNIVFCSAYRSVKRQEQVFNDSMDNRVQSGMDYWEAYQETSESVAIPGTSEHGLGLAVDLISNQYTELDEAQSQTKEAKWLKEHCHKYGFILRYPPEKTYETGIIFEPWHYRYVGVEDATKIMAQGVTLETYLSEYQ